MKMFNQHTGREVEALTDEQVSKLIEWECADQGAPMLPPMPDKPEKPVFVKDMTIYQVGEYSSFYTDNEADAIKLLAALASVKLYELDYTGSNYDAKYARPKNTNETKTCAIQCYSPQNWDKIRKEYEQYTGLNKEYEKQMKEYNEACKARSQTSDYIWEKVHAARSQARSREIYKGYLKHYVDLAEGNNEVGLKFFHKAYPNAHNWLTVHIHPTKKNVLVINDVYYHDSDLQEDIKSGD